MEGVQFLDNEDKVSVHCGLSKTATEIEEERNFDFMDEM
jgi:hypothetical protein